MRRLAMVATIVLALATTSSLALGTATPDSTSVGALVRVNPLAVSISSLRSARPGQAVKFTAEVANQGPVAVGSIQLQIVAPSGVSIEPGPLDGPTLPSHGTLTGSWTACAPTPGNYLLVARATATSPTIGVLTSDSAAVVFVVAGKDKACR